MDEDFHQRPTAANPDQGEAFVRLLLEHEPQVRSFLRGLLPAWNDVDEVIQEASLVAWRKFADFQEGTAFGGWFLTIARFEAWSSDGIARFFELRTRAGIPKIGPLEPELATTLKHAYLACVSYVDAQIGLMVAALEEAGIRDNTIIIVWGDHGWHLGDMGVWGKATNYEIATRVPLMIWTPNMKTRGDQDRRTRRVGRHVSDALRIGGCADSGALEGHSFVPLLDEPDQPWKKAAFSQYPNPALREWAANPLSPGMRETWFGPLIEEVEERIIAQQGDKWNRELFEQHLMGYTMRTDRYRLVVWRDHRDPKAEPIFIELYDHQTDPSETKNVANDNPEIVSALTKATRRGLEEGTVSGFGSRTR